MYDNKLTILSSKFINYNLYNLKTYLD